MEEYQARVVNKVNSILNKYEQIILLVVLIPISCKLFDVAFPSILSIMILAGVGTVYFFSAFPASVNAENSEVDTFAHKLIGWASSVTLIGITFFIQKWPYSEPMILIGSITLFIALIYIIIKKVKNPSSEIFKNILIVRVFLFILISVILFLFQGNRTIIFT